MNINSKMKILVISDEVWNDNLHGNNVLTNWFEGFNAEFANIYCSPGHPQNKCCKKYFQITDKMMFKSIIGNQKAGLEVVFNSYPVILSDSMLENEDKKLYGYLKSIVTEELRFLRELIWINGRYDEEKIKKFIEEADPDIIFSPRKATLKLLKLEKLVKQIANKPMVVFTGDDEYSLQQLRFSPIYWIRRFIIRKHLRENSKIYDLYYTHSQEQGTEYSKKLNVVTKTLLKCGIFSSNKIHNKLHKPIRMVYAGKLYCNRWKSLAAIGKALKLINREDTRMILDIYTKDKVSKKQNKMLNDGENIFIRGAVSPDKLQDIYDEADIALHTESFDLKNRLLTKFSFSTKIIDCMASGCAVMAICWKHHAGYVYLKKEDAAFTIDSENGIYTKLKQITDKPDLIKEYAKKAYNCGIKNHQKDDVQKMLMDDFSKIINSSKR